MNVLTSLLDKGAGANVHDGHGYTTLTAAIVERAGIEVINLLIGHGADVNYTDGEGWTPLTAAIAIEPDGNLIHILLSNGADSNRQDGHHHTPLTAALKYNVNANVISLLLSHGADPCGHDGHGQTPLKAALEHQGDKSVVSLLLNHGADPCIQDGHGQTPLIAALEHRADTSVMSLLLSHGADPCGQDGRGHTPLTAAIEHWANTSVISMLLNHGADPSGQDGRGQTPLMTAVEYWADTNLMSLLLSHGANPCGQDGRGQTPLMTALEYCADSNVMSLLLSHGADPITPLTAALEHNASIDTLDCLLNNDADLANQDDKGDTPLNVALTSMAGLKVIQKLLDRGADPNQEDRKGSTPLLVAIQSRAEISIITLLLDRGASPNKKGLSGLTPVKAALGYQDISDSIDSSKLGIQIQDREDLFRSLIQHGASICELTEIEQTSIVQRALQSEDFHSIRALVDFGYDIKEHLRFSQPNNYMAGWKMLWSSSETTRKMQVAMHGCPPTATLMSQDEWYRTSFYLGLDLIRSITTNPDLENSCSKGCVYLPVTGVLPKPAENLLLNKEEVYKMTSQPRGRAIIINIREFTDKTYRTRRGSEHDVRRLAKLFLQLGFDVEKWDTKKQCTAENLRKEIENEKKHSTHRVADAFVFVIMSHGDKHGNLLSSDEKTLNIKKDIVYQFDGENWPVMLGKPKLFLIQACRGDEMFYSCDPVHVDHVGKDTYKARTARPDEVHPKADIVKIYSTYEDYLANRIGGKEDDPAAGQGAWFIREFVLACELFAHTDHILDLVTKANTLLQRRKSPGSSSIQTAELSSSLRKKCYFFPGYYELHSSKKKCSLM